MTSDFRIPSLLSAPRLNFYLVKCIAFHLPDLTHGLRCMILERILYSSGKFLERRAFTVGGALGIKTAYNKDESFFGFSNFVPPK